ncbi:MAG: beta-N-acetylhexosaminidase [Lachnospiraceae bacterium]
MDKKIIIFSLIAFIAVIGIIVAVTAGHTAPQPVTGEYTSVETSHMESLVMESSTQSTSVPQSSITETHSQTSSHTESNTVSTSVPTKPEAPSTVEDYLSQMSLHEKVCQMFIVTNEQLLGVQSTVTTADDASRVALTRYPVGGIICFASNIVDRAQTIALTSNLQKYSKLGLFISVDEEGGRVTRIASNPAMGTTLFPAMGEIGDANQVYNVGKTIGQEISNLGFNLDFAPVADVNSNPANTVIGTRAFSSDAKTAATLVSSCVKGFLNSRMLCTLKHFPGHGDTMTDSHYGDALQTKTLQQLEACEFLPFKAGIESGVPFVMMGHIMSPNVEDDNLPASISHFWVTEILKNRLGFTGIVITDAMRMKAITDRYSSGDAAVMAVNAGIDIILMPDDLQQAVEGIEKAVSAGTISEERINESVRKILSIKKEYGIISLHK